MANLDIVARVEDRTRSGVSSASQNMGRLRGSIGGVGKAAGVAALGVAGIAAAGVAIGTKLVGDFLSAADEIGKMATRTGISVEELQKLDFALQQGGSSIERFEKGIQTFNKGLFDAAEKGTGPVAEGLAALGLEIEAIQALSPDEQFSAIADAISMVADPTEQAALAQKFFGGAGRELLPTLKAGAEGIAALTEEAERNGNIMSTETVRGAEAVNDAINSAKQALIGIATDGFSALLPHIQTFIFWFKDEVVPVIRRDVVPIIRTLIMILQESLVPVIRDTVIPAIKRIAALFGDGGEGDGEGLRKALQALQKVFETVIPIVATITELAFKVIFSSIELVIKIIKELLNFITAVFTGDWRGAWEAIQGIVTAFVDHFRNVFEAGFDFVSDLAFNFGIKFRNLWVAIANGVIKVVEAIPNAFVDGINAIIRAWNNFALRIPGFSRKISLPFGKSFNVGFDGVTINTPDIPTVPRVNLPRLQEGGIVTRRTLAEIGEAGPEAVVPLNQAGRFGVGSGTMTLRIALNLDGERLGEFVVNRVNLANNNGELDLVAASA